MAGGGRWLARLLDALFVGVAVLLVLAALYVSLGRALAPLAAEYRDELQAELSALLGQPLRIGRVEGRWQGLAPQLLLGDLQLDVDGEALYLERLQLQPDLLASLRSGSLRIARLELQGLQLAVQEDAAGHWRLKGLRQDGTPGAGVDPQAILAPLLAIGQLSLLDSRLTLEPWQGEVLAFNYLGMTLGNGRDGLRLDVRLRLPDGQPLSAQLQARIDPAHWQQAAARLYLSLPQSDWAALLHGRLPAAWQVGQLRAGGELWLDWAGGQVRRAAVRLHGPQLQLQHAGESSEFGDLALSAHFSREAQGWRLLVDSLAGSFAGQRLDPGRLQLDHQASESADGPPRWRLQAERLDLAPLSALAGRLAPLPPLAAELLASLAPRGQLRELHAELSPREAGLPELSYRLRLDRVGVSAWHGVPALENVSGSLAGSLEGGELRLDAEDFLLHLDTLFAEPWRYRRARAQLNWSLDAEAFSLHSALMRLSGEEGELAGNMLIRLRRDPAAEDYMDLQVGLRDGSAAYVGRYLPTRSPGLDPQLAEWLQASIRGGRIDEGLFVYQGALNKGAAAQARALGLYFKVRDAELAYQPDWPPLTRLRGEVFVEDDGVRVQAPFARVLDSRLREVRATVDTQRGTPRLQVAGRVQGSVGDGLKILQDTPLGRGGQFVGWQGEGPLDGRLQLDIPLVRGGEVAAQVDFTTEGARLRLREPDLELSALRGAFRYDTARGLSAPEVRARAFGRELRGVLHARGQAGRPHTRLDLRGSIAVERLVRWLGGDPAQQPASGELPYRLWLDLGAAGNRLRVSSDLQGTAIDLPAPLGKPAEQVRSASWRMSLDGSERRYSLNYAGLASLEFAAPPGQLAGGRGELRLGGAAAQLPREPGLRLRGTLDEIDGPAWQAVQARYAGQGAASGVLLQSAELSIGRLRAGSLSLEALRVSLQRRARDWRLWLDSPQLLGAVVLPADEAQPLRIELERLRLPAAAPLTASAPAARSDPLAEVDPRRLPALDLQVHHLFRGEERLGRLSLRSRPSGSGALVEALDADLHGLRLQGSLDWQGSGIASRSHYRGSLGGGDLAEVLQAWGYAPSIGSRSFQVEIDGSWPGSPAMAGLTHFSGSLQLQARRGQLYEVDGGASVLRVFGLLNFDSLSRRLRLDFSDLLGRGLSYDSIDGRLVGTDGVLLTRGPLVLDGPSTRLELDGQLDMASEQIAARLRVTLPLSNNLPLAALLAGAAPVAGALFIVDRLVGDRLSRVASVDYRIDGSWQNPQISLFGKPAEQAR